MTGEDLKHRKLLDYEKRRGRGGGVGGGGGDFQTGREGEGGSLRKRWGGIIHEPWLV